MKIKRNFLQDIKLLFKKLTNLEASVRNRKIKVITEEDAEVFVQEDDDIFIQTPPIIAFYMPPVTDSLIGKEYTFITNTEFSSSILQRAEGSTDRFFAPGVSYGGTGGAVSLVTDIQEAVTVVAVEGGWYLISSTRGF